MHFRVKDIISVLIGNTMFAFAVAFFVLPNGLAMGGGTGLSLIATHFKYTYICFYIDF